MDGSFSLLSLYNQNSVNNNNNAMTGFNLRISGTQSKYTLPSEIGTVTSLHRQHLKLNIK